MQVLGLTNKNRKCKTDLGCAEGEGVVWLGINGRLKKSILSSLVDNSSNSYYLLDSFNCSSSLLQKRHLTCCCHLTAGRLQRTHQSPSSQPHLPCLGWSLEKPTTKSYWTKDAMSYMKYRACHATKHTLGRQDEHSASGRGLTRRSAKRRLRESWRAQKQKPRDS